jgi:hypothetical protein
MVGSLVPEDTGRGIRFCLMEGHGKDLSRCQRWPLRNRRNNLDTVLFSDGDVEPGQRVEDFGDGLQRRATSPESLDGKKGWGLGS